MNGGASLFNPPQLRIVDEERINNFSNGELMIGWGSARIREPNGLQEGGLIGWYPVSDVCFNKVDFPSERCLYQWLRMNASIT